MSCPLTSTSPNAWQKHKKLNTAREYRAFVVSDTACEARNSDGCRELCASAVLGSTMCVMEETSRRGHAKCCVQFLEQLVRRALTHDMECRIWWVKARWRTERYRRLEQVRPRLSIRPVSFRFNIPPFWIQIESEGESSNTSAEYQ